MKKFALLLLLVTAASMTLAAQDTDIYATTLYVERVYPTTMGYRVDYRRQSSLMLATSYLPLEWFGGVDALARLVYADGDAVPFVNIFWEDGELSHFVLYVKRNVNDLTWGTLELTDDMRARFDVESPEFHF
ncbi:MAG: hypothetical protein ACOC1U_10975 [Spirochaetota bacterium]